MEKRKGPRKYDRSLVEKLAKSLRKPIEVKESQVLTGTALIKELAPFIRDQHDNYKVSYERIAEHLKEIEPTFDLSAFTIREYSKLETNAVSLPDASSKTKRKQVSNSSKNTAELKSNNNQDIKHEKDIASTIKAEVDPVVESKEDEKADASARELRMRARANRTIEESK